ncbi:hypothetical protein C8Q77DRAFT_1074956 [Trametes polyzona]|nr:hypothetical protein C8Q77DRAFT_1074956 [Trametes polyzona]
MSSVISAIHQDENGTQKRPLSDMLSQTFAPFDHHSKVVAPFDDETKRDAEFIEKLNTMLLELILEFHAWSAARPMYESDKTADTLEQEVKALREAEKDQGRSLLSSTPSPCTMPAPGFVEQTRQRLNDFITRIKLALAALTGLAP